MTVTLTLGAVRFQGFEVPESIPIGGDQALVVHKLPGGARVVDAMGADHKDISWTGRFRGGSAQARSRQLDGYRIAGEPLTLTWGGYRYRVIVRSFEAQFQQPFEIPYSITCLVVADESAPIAAPLPGLDELIGADLGKLLGLDGPLSIADVAEGVNAVQSVVASVGSLRAASKDSLGSLAGALVGAQAATQGAIAQISGTLGFAAPADPTAIAAQLSGQANAFGQLNELYQASSTLGRMTKNLGNVGS